MTPADKQAVTARARDDGISVGEFMRRAALASHDTKEQEVRAALEVLNETNAKASAALNKALAEIEANEKSWEERERRAIEDGKALAASLMGKT
jgi:hypothetical protein